ncbi:MAG: GTP-binding protein [Burkholderiaceae bacterium]
MDQCRREFKILVTGSHGAGKTSIVGALGEHAPVATEAANPADPSGQATTTVGLDYAELSVAGRGRVRLFGTPGLQRFKFMRTILAAGAYGLIVLIDSRRGAALAELDHAIDSFDDLIARSAVVVGVTHRDEAPGLSIACLTAALGARSLHVPVLAIDGRKCGHARLLLETLLHSIETAG